MIKIKLKFIIVSFALLMLSSTTVEAQERNNKHRYDGDRALMTSAVLEKLVVWTRPSDKQRTYVEHCRTLPHGCEKQIAELVDYIFDVAIEENVDPWLLAGVAWHESRFNAFAESHAGAVGYFQLLRRSHWSRGLRFVHQRQYRDRCRQEIGSCQRPLVERAVYWLKRAIEHCGSVQGGLRAYNSGKCTGPRRYPRAVFAAQRDILTRAKRIAENNFVVPTREFEGPVYVHDLGNEHILCTHTNSLTCEEPEFENYWCSEHSTICVSDGIDCQCE